MIAQHLRPAGERARIGPNAITRTIEAMRERLGIAVCADLLSAAGLGRYGRGGAEPTSMVPEDDVTELFGTLRARLDAAQAGAIARLAGEKTARYVLAKRIPQPVALLLRCLPARLAAVLLLKSIAKHTWTFAGSAVVAIRLRPLGITLAGCPVCRGAHGAPALCEYYAASFETLFRELVSRRAVVRELACEAFGGSACVFEIRC